MRFHRYTAAFCALALAACSRPPVPPPTLAAEQLTCGDGSMPRAVYARAARPTRLDTLSGVAIIMEDSAHGRVRVADVQLWDHQGMIGGPGDSSGMNVITDREPGLHSLRVRLEAAGPRWMYIATLRPGHVDTVTITVGTSCTLVWRG